MTSDTAMNFAESASNLGHLSLSGSSAYGSSHDEVVVCDTTQSPSCYSASSNDDTFNLYKGWSVAEFNIFGFGSDSQAVLGGTSTSGSLGVELNEEQDSGSLITPTCDSVGLTGETNSLSLNSNSCTDQSNGDMTFSESGYHLTMESNGYGSVTPPSGYFGGTVKIDAIASTGYYFGGWTGSCSTGCSGYYTGTSNPATVTMNGPITEYATFDKCCGPSA